MFKRTPFCVLVGTVFLLCASLTPAQPIELNSPAILGNFELTKDQLKKIQEAVTKALDGKIDSDIECGEVTQDCLVRAARQWSHEGSTFREILIAIHTLGHTTFTVEKPEGKAWPAIVIKK